MGILFAEDKIQSLLSGRHFRLDCTFTAVIWRLCVCCAQTILKSLYLHAKKSSVFFGEVFLPPPEQHHISSEPLSSILLLYLEPIRKVLLPTVTFTIDNMYNRKGCRYYRPIVTFQHALMTFRIGS